MPRITFRSLLAVLAVAATFALIGSQADARPPSNIGSRASKTNTAPPPTATAPNTAKPIERTVTQPGTPGAPSIARPGTPAAPASGFFNRPGLLGGLAAGFLGAGLIGMLFGHGLTGNLGGIASFIGLIVQIGLVALVAMLVWRWWQRRQNPAMAMAGAPSMHDNMANPARPNILPFTGFGSAAPAAPPQQAVAGTDEVGLHPADFDTFERLLGEVQTAYGAEDLSALRARTTPEMVSYFSESLSENASKGVVNQLSDIKLLQGDLAEAWREGDVDYASVALRFSVVDRTIERASGRVIEGDATHPQEIAEVWTFLRARGGSWMVTAIQDT